MAFTDKRIPIYHDLEKGISLHEVHGEFRIYLSLTTRHHEIEGYDIQAMADIAVIQNKMTKEDADALLLHTIPT